MVELFVSRADSMVNVRSVGCPAVRLTRPGAAVSGILLAFICTAPAWASPSQESPADTDTLETIVVTAGKRSERVQDLPTSVWVATDEVLDRNMARDFDDLARIAPSLTITKTTQPANNSINIRGIGTYAFSIATKPSVSVVVDDVPQAFQAQAFTALADVAQVEILRGPQSTLFGTSASAGVINITTQAPGSSFSTGARAMATDDGEQRVSGYVSGPLGEAFSARVFAGSVSYRGSLRNVYTGNWVNGHKDLFARTSLQWAPATDWKVRLAAYWTDTSGTCCTTASYALSPGVTYGRFLGYSAPQPTVLAGVTPGSNNRRISADIDPAADSVDRGGSLRVEHQLGRHSLLWITGFDRYDLHDLQDTDGSSFNWGPGGANLPGAVAGGSANGGSFRVDALNSELRLLSPAQDRWHYVAAVAASRTGDTRVFVRGSNSLEQYGSRLTVPPTTSAYSSYRAHAIAEDLALFGTSTFAATSRLDLVTGLRLNHERLNYSFVDRFNHVSYGIPECSSTTPSGLSASTCDSFDSVTGKAAVVFHLAPSWMVFGGYDRGYKGAAYDLTSTYTTRAAVTAPGPDNGFPLADVVASRQPVAPESVDAFQLGAKGALADHLAFSVTLFDETVHNFQAQSRDELTQQNILNSVQRVTTRGVELELSASLTRRLAFNAAGSYTDATTAKFPNATCYSSQTAALGCIAGKQDLSGQTLANAPRWNFSVDGKYVIPVSRGEVFLDASCQWQSSVMNSLLQDPDSRQGAYGLMNLSLGWQRDHWKAKAFVVNALDQNYSLTRARDGNWNINPYGALAGPITDAIRWAPGRDSKRYLGLELSAQL